MHTPVLISEVMKYLAPQKGEHIIDATFGAGGYSKQILDSSECSLLAIDRDVSTKTFADQLSKEYPKRFHYLNLDFGNLDLVSEQYKEAISFDGIVFDIGVSSMQLDIPERGFSFRAEAPLDMRMDQSAALTAYDIVNTYEERRLADVIYQFGGERKSFQIARAIVQAREIEPIRSTKELSKIIHGAVGHYRDEINPATRTFQAIRMEVNDELNQLQLGLQHAKSLLKVGGRLLVVTFHSGEDRIAKQFFNQLCGREEHSNRHLPSIEEQKTPASFSFLFKGTIKAEYEEIKKNPRARSAKLRGIMRIK